MGRRQDRLGGQLVREISLLLQREVKDPRIGFATVQRVDLTEDLSFAKVYVSVLGNDKQEKSALIGLQRVAPFLRSSLGKMLKIRQVPELRFIIDKNLDHSDRISELLSQLDEPDLSHFDSPESKESDDTNK